MRHSSVLTLALASAAGLLACSGSDTSTPPPSDTGGATAAAGGTGSSSGGTSSNVTGTALGGNAAGGTTLSSTTSSTGGTPGTGGTSRPTGGSKATGGVNSTGGSRAAGGGVTTGGTAATGGSRSTGGTQSGTGGAAPTGGSRNATGGTASTGGSRAAGGASPTGGSRATGGSSTTASGGSTGTCTPTWNPPATASGNTGIPAGLDAVWAHTGATIMAANNIKIYQIMANKGSLNYCVRWDATTAINATERDQIEALIQKCDKQWIDQLAGWGCWPYPTVNVKVSLWAVKDRTLLNWDDSTTTARVVVNSTADCPTDCGPWDPNNAHSNCSSAKYDEFFWLDGTVTTFTGWGSATGFMMGETQFLSSAKTNPNTYVILAHEMGHSHGLDDFYDWQPAGWTSYVMLSGSSAVVTETDGWMLRDVWRHVRSKYGYPGP